MKAQIIMRIVQKYITTLVTRCLKSNKLEESVEAYKTALKFNPNDQDTKYNLSYALEMLKNKDKDKNKQDKNDQNKDQNKDTTGSAESGSTK
ncbi:MAG: tetratricopeptide repeat protein [Ignavibacteriales bacterium]|nr:tetratricopeptide repeat protein [Ignavibacteriales bacterium]